MKKTFEQWREFNIMTQNYLMRTNGADTKLLYAINRIRNKELKNVFKEFNEDILDIKIEHCFVDSDGVIIYDRVKDERGIEQKEFKFTKEGLRNKDKATIKLMEEYDKKEIDVEPFIVEDVLQEFSEEELDAFRGVIIPLNYVNPVSENEKLPDDFLKAVCKEDK